MALYDFSPLCVLRCVLKLPAWDGICVGSPHCVVSNVSSKCLLEKIRSYTGCIFLFVSTVPSSSNFVFTAVHYVMSNVSANYFPKRMHDHSEIYPIPSTYSTTVLYSTMCLQMFPQNVRTRKCIATLVAFVRLFSTMHFQMFPKIACPEGCIIALAAFFFIFLQNVLPNDCLDQ